MHRNSNQQVDIGPKIALAIIVGNQITGFLRIF